MPSLDDRPHAADEPPRVVRWYLAYAIGMALFLFALTMASVLLLAFEKAPDDALPAVLVNVALCFPLTCAYGIAPFLPRRRGAWAYGVVLISCGLICGCWIAAAIPLLVHWLRPETQAWFGRSAATS